MPSSWTEPAVEASLTATVGVAGRTICVKVPDDWKPGRQVRLLLLPSPPFPRPTEKGPKTGATQSP